MTTGWLFVLAFGAVSFGVVKPPATSELTAHQPLQHASIAVFNRFFGCSTRKSPFSPNNNPHHSSFAGGPHPWQPWARRIPSRVATCRTRSRPGFLSLSLALSLCAHRPADYIGSRTHVLYSSARLRPSFRQPNLAAHQAQVWSYPTRPRARTWA